MADEAATMNAALTALDTALGTVATQCAAYATACQAALLAEFNRAGSVQQAALSDVIGTRALEQMIVRRMRGLGLQGVLDCARTPGSAEDFSVLGAKATGLVKS